MNTLDSTRHQLSIHGLAVDLRCEVPLLDLPIQQALGEFVVSEWPERFTPISGAVRPYDESTVLRRLSPTARPVATGSAELELYEERERFWLVDDRWGLAEINLLKGQWQSWILPEPSMDSVRVLEQAVRWPMAQLLRSRGMTMLPAASITRGGFGFLLIASFAIEPELSALLRAGYKIVGQQWTALREEDGRVAMLHLPGLVERIAPPRLRAMSAGGLDSAYSWVDLESEQCGAAQHHAFVDAVMIVERGRRPLPMLKPVARAGSLAALRSAWPIVELHPQRRHGQMPAKLAQLCPIFDCQFSRRTDNLLTMVQQISESHRTPMRASA